MNMSKVFSKISKTLMLETVVLLYINAIFIILTVIPTHMLSLLVKVPRVLYKDTLYRA